MSRESRPTTLKRSISLPMLILYGTGTMVGGGFYALVGKVAGIAGMYAPLCMLLSASLALFSALSFSELSARFPASAGEAVYFERAFGVRWLSILLGWMVILTGVVSTATLANAIVLFLQDNFALPREAGLIACISVLGLIAAWGIAESLIVAVSITVVEIGGLLYLLFVSREPLRGVAAVWGELIPPPTIEATSPILLGAFLVFYGYLGFEDIVNVAEEVKRPRRNLPIAILSSLAITTLLYMAVSLAAVLSLSPEALTHSLNPLAEVVEHNGGRGRSAMVVISVLAGVNGALVQIVMASRVAYGLSDKGLGPRFLARIHPRRQTPLFATSLVVFLVALLALGFPLVALAELTSSIILVVFAAVNLSLWKLRRRETSEDKANLPAEGPRYPRWVPVIGFLACLAFLALRWLGPT